MLDTTSKSGVRTIKPVLVHVRFEQGRGDGGCPNCFVALYPGAVDGPKAFEVATIVQLAVSHMRALCTDPNSGHGKDIMPGDDSEYELHYVSGGRIKELKDFRFEAREDGFVVSETVLTWGNPGRKLADQMTVNV